MKIKKIVSGIHTLELTLRSRNYADNQNIVDALKEQGPCAFTYQNHAHTEQRIQGFRTAEHPGIAARIQLSHDFRSRTKWIITPESELKGHDSPLSLFSGKKKKLSELCDLLRGYFDQLEIPEQKQECTVSRLDLTMDLYLPADADMELIIHILRKSLGSSRYVQMFLDDTEANRHLCEFALSAKKSKSPQVACKAYDKIYELKQNNRCPKKAQKENILRLELTLRRDALLKRLQVDRDASVEEIIAAAAKHQNRIMRKAWRLLCPCTGDYVPYDRAMVTIQNSRFADTEKEQMLYLLRKTSDSRDLATALHKLQKEYALGKKDTKKLLERFDTLGIHPVTIPQNEHLKAFPNILTVMDCEDGSV